ncbi:hypothetical protein ENH_00066800, partial [Eimeria necatrix]
SSSSTNGSSIRSSSSSSSSSSGGVLGEGLLDLLVPVCVREGARKGPHSHLRLLVERLQYCLESQRQQFASECKLAEDWAKRHAQGPPASAAETESEAEGGGAEAAAAAGKRTAEQ